MDADKKIKKSLEEIKAIELEKIEKSKKKLKELEKKVQEKRNKKLLYEFKDLDDLVNYYGKNKTEVLDKMEKAGYFYNKEENQFKRK